MSKKCWVWKNFGSKKFLPPKKFWVQRNFESKKIFGQENFRPKKCWVKRISVLTCLTLPFPAWLDLSRLDLIFPVLILLDPNWLDLSWQNWPVLTWLGLSHLDLTCPNLTSMPWLVLSWLDLLWLEHDLSLLNLSLIAMSWLELP